MLSYIVVEVKKTYLELIFWVDQVGNIRELLIVTGQHIALNALLMGVFALSRQFFQEERQRVFGMGKVFVYYHELFLDYETLR